MLNKVQNVQVSDTTSDDIKTKAGNKILFIQGSSYITERINNTCKYIKSQHRILIPAFIFVVKQIIYLHPSVKLRKQFKLDANIYICRRFQLLALSKFVTILRTIPEIKFTLDKKIFYDLPTQRTIQFNRQKSPRFFIAFKRTVLIECCTCKHRKFFSNSVTNLSV